MTSLILRIVFTLLFLVLMDIYAFQAFKAAADGWLTKPMVKWGFWGAHIIFYGALMAFIVMMSRGVKVPNYYFNTIFTLTLILYLPKIILIIFLLFEDISRGIRWILAKTDIWDTRVPEPSGGRSIPRAKFISLMAMGLAAIPFSALIWGAIKTKYDFMVKQVALPLKNLPDAFVGMKIVQISDIHSGSYNNREAVQRGVDLIKEQNADLVMFTGDIVNLRTEEMEPWKDVFGQISAPMGVYSILGNHDYGNYVRDWKPGEKEKNFRDLLRTHADMGWKLLLNEHVMLEREGQQIALIGCENWSARMGGHNYGDLAKASAGTGSAAVKLLMSHDPSHWDAEIRKDYPEIQATFSGHTHGLQMGIEIPGFKWSPIQYVYKQWAGLYQKGDQFLYVNRGFGFNAYAGRVGIRPEITVFELQKA